VVHLHDPVGGLRAGGDDLHDQQHALRPGGRDVDRVRAVDDDIRSAVGERDVLEPYADVGVCVPVRPGRIAYLNGQREAGFTVQSEGELAGRDPGDPDGRQTGVVARVGDHRRHAADHSWRGKSTTLEVPVRRSHIASGAARGR
jgi:hypothetical protein